MPTSYLERAQNWLNSGEDIEKENIESTIFKFSTEIKKNFNSSTQNESKIKDLTATISYLKNWIEFLPEPVSLQNEASIEKKNNNKQYELDSSSLFDHTIQPKIISHEERLSSLLKIKNSPNIISASELLSKK